MHRYNAIKAKYMHRYNAIKTKFKYYVYDQLNLT